MQRKVSGYFARKTLRGAQHLLREKALEPGTNTGIFLERYHYYLDPPAAQRRMVWYGNRFLAPNGLYVWGQQKAEQHIQAVEAGNLKLITLDDVEIYDIPTFTRRDMESGKPWAGFKYLLDLQPGFLPDGYITRQLCEISGDPAEVGFLVIDSTSGNKISGGSLNRFFLTYDVVKHAPPVDRRKLLCRACKKHDWMDVLIHRRGGTFNHRTWYLALCDNCRAYPENWNIPKLDTWVKVA